MIFKESYKDVAMIIREVVQDKASIHVEVATIIRQEIWRFRIKELEKSTSWSIWKTAKLSKGSDAKPRVFSLFK